MDLILAKGYIGMPGHSPPIDVADVLSVHAEVLDALPDDVECDDPLHWVAYVRMKNRQRIILLSMPVAYPNAEYDATEAAERFARAYYSARLGGSPTYTPCPATPDDTPGVLQRYDVTGVTSSCSRTVSGLAETLGRPVTAVTVEGTNATVTFTVYSTTTCGAFSAGEAYASRSFGADWSWSATLSPNQDATPDLGKYVIMEGEVSTVELTPEMVGGL